MRKPGKPADLSKLLPGRPQHYLAAAVAFLKILLGLTAASGAVAHTGRQAGGSAL